MIFGTYHDWQHIFYSINELYLIYWHSFEAQREKVGGRRFSLATLNATHTTTTTKALSLQKHSIQSNRWFVRGGCLLGKSNSITKSTALIILLDVYFCTHDIHRHQLLTFIASTLYYAREKGNIAFCWHWIRSGKSSAQHVNIFSLSVSVSVRLYKRGRHLHTLRFNKINHSTNVVKDVMNIIMNMNKYK